MPKLISVKRVELAPHHLNPGRTEHSISDRHGLRPFPPFTSLEIAHYECSPGYYLFHICADGQAADTWHESLDDALYQAEWEFGVKVEEWQDIHRQF
ncbi:MAG TPA: hypothetical protein VFP59_00015 [Candidatus Angelobacter sp.]|nr:hypothetical protein [Candidatus Angelobacter sp.]